MRLKSQQFNLISALRMHFFAVICSKMRKKVKTKDFYESLFH